MESVPDNTEVGTRKAAKAKKATASPDSESDPESVPDNTEEGTRDDGEDKKASSIFACRESDEAFLSSIFASRESGGPV
jgi:hypothetical protein